MSIKEILGKVEKEGKKVTLRGYASQPKNALWLWLLLLDVMGSIKEKLKKTFPVYLSK